jgi:hypothetical protein
MELREKQRQATPKEKWTEKPPTNPGNSLLKTIGRTTGTMPITLR